ncbi:hypothetical protein D3Z36_16065 [Lachnospiraceae bacterium]|nr:hypothetical protein [Lachnospiraceae bacterium]
MGENQDGLKRQEINLDKVNEELLDILSLLIVLESDMEAQKSDSVHLRLVGMVHDGVKRIQGNLPKSGSQEE